MTFKEVRTEETNSTLCNREMVWHKAAFKQLWTHGIVRAIVRVQLWKPCRDKIALSK
jgi:hypothetical protein